MRQPLSRLLAALRLRKPKLFRSLGVVIALTCTTASSGALAAAPAHRDPVFPSAVAGVVLSGGELSPLAISPLSPPAALGEEPALLDEALPGPSAVQALDDDGVELAADRNGMTPGELTHLLATDSSAWLDESGRLFYVEPAAPSIPAAAPEIAPYSYDETFELHSKPGSKRTIYLDFDGHTISGSAWQPGYVSTDPMTVLAFDTDGDPGSFSNTEMDRIQSVWQRVAEDYAPFDVDVTTEDPGLAALNRIDQADKVYGTRVVITDTPAFCSCGGVAYVGVFNAVNGVYYQPAWVFANSLSDGAKNIAEAASHEAGHNVGLNHDGQGSAGYYTGHSPWAPIMGVGYYQPVVQFSKGEYDNPTNTENDFVKMASKGVVERDDDHSDTKTDSSLLTSTRKGVVSSEDDVDVFRFVAPSDGTVTFEVDPAPVSPNLDTVLEVRKAGWALITRSAPEVARVTNDVASGMGSSAQVDVEEGKKYYLVVSGDAYATPSTGYSRYGSIGQYTIRVVGVTNDNLAHSGHLDGNAGKRVGTNVGATGQGAETAGTCVADSQINSVWWSWTAETTGTAEVDTIGSGFNTTMTVYTGPKVSKLTEVSDGCNDDISSGNKQSRVIFDLVVGQTYRIRVDGAGSAVGKVKLHYQVSDEIMCAGYPATIVGSGSAETIVGTAGADVIAGLGGGDILKGKGGADIICGNGGSDTIKGGGGGDVVGGGKGDDAIDGGSGSDHLEGNAGGDWLLGGPGSDVCAGGPGDDLVGGGCEVLKTIP